MATRDLDSRPCLVANQRSSVRPSVWGVCKVDLSVTTLMGVPGVAYGAYAYAPGVGLRIASDYFCEGKKDKNDMSCLELREIENFFLLNVLVLNIPSIFSLNLTVGCQFA